MAYSLPNDQFGTLGVKPLYQFTYFIVGLARNTRCIDGIDFIVRPPFGPRTYGDTGGE